MVGATTTFCGEASRTRCLKYSAMRKSLLSCKWRPCSLDSAPRGTTTTESEVSTRSASSQVRFSRRMAAALFWLCCTVGALGACSETAGMAGRNHQKSKAKNSRLGLFTAHLESVQELLGDGSGLDSAVEIVNGADSPNKAGLPREAKKFAQAVNALDAGAMRAENTGGLVFPEFAGSPGKLLVGCGEEVESADGGVNRSGAEKAASVLKCIDDSGVAAAG